MFEQFLTVKDALSLYINDNALYLILPEEWKIIEIIQNSDVDSDEWSFWRL